MIVFTFSILYKDDKERFFEKSFLLANVKPDVILKILFLTINNTNVDFQARDLQWRSYITGDILLIIRKVKLIEKKEIIIATLDSEYEAFVVYITVLSVESGDKVHPSIRAQIAHLKVDKSPIEVLASMLILKTFFHQNWPRNFQTIRALTIR